MNIERHSLAKELPEFKDKIHDLKLSDGHFSKLFKDYHEVDNEVIRIEDGVEHSSDEYLESLKNTILVGFCSRALVNSVVIVVKEILASGIDYSNMTPGTDCIFQMTVLCSTIKYQIFCFN